MSVFYHNGLRYEVSDPKFENFSIKSVYKGFDLVWGKISSSYNDGTYAFLGYPGSLQASYQGYDTAPFSVRGLPASVVWGNESLLSIINDCRIVYIDNLNKYKSDTFGNGYYAIPCNIIGSKLNYLYEFYNPLINGSTSYIWIRDLGDDIGENTDRFKYNIRQLNRRIIGFNAIEGVFVTDAKDINHIVVPTLGGGFRVEPICMEEGGAGQKCGQSLWSLIENMDLNLCKAFEFGYYQGGLNNNKGYNFKWFIPPNVDNLYTTFEYNCWSKQTPLCGKYTIDLSGTYRGCTRIQNHAACGRNVINMNESYLWCTSYRGYPVCGPNVIDFHRAYSQIGYLNGNPVFGENVRDATYAYAYTPSYSSKSLNIIIPYNQSTSSDGLNYSNALYTAYVNNGDGDLYLYGNQEISNYITWDKITPFNYYKTGRLKMDIHVYKGSGIDNLLFNKKDSNADLWGGSKFYFDYDKKVPIEPYSSKYPEWSIMENGYYNKELNVYIYNNYNGKHTYLKDYFFPDTYLYAVSKISILPYHKGGFANRSFYEYNNITETSSSYNYNIQIWGEPIDIFRQEYKVVNKRGSSVEIRKYNEIILYTNVNINNIHIGEKLYRVATHGYNLEDTHFSTWSYFNYDRTINMCDSFGTYFSYNKKDFLLPASGENVVDMSSTYSQMPAEETRLNVIGPAKCGNNVVNFDHCYEQTNVNRAACGSNVIYMTSTYYNTYKLQGPAYCGEKVLYMNRTYGFFGTYKGNQEEVEGFKDPVCGSNVIDMTEAYYAREKMIGQPMIGINVVKAEFAYCECHNLTGNPVFSKNLRNCEALYYNCHNLLKYGFAELNIKMNMIYECDISLCLYDWDGTHDYIIDYLPKKSIYIYRDTPFEKLYFTNTNINNRYCINSFPSRLGFQRRLSYDNSYFILDENTRYFPAYNLYIYNNLNDIDPM